MSFSAYSKAIHIYFSCITATTRDKGLFKQLKTHLSSLKRKGIIDELCDNEHEIRNNGEQLVETPIDLADMNVLLISPDFLSSDRCYEIEMKRAIARSETSNTPLILVLLRPTDLKGTPLEQYRPLPLDGKPLSRSSDIDAALAEVVDQIGKIAAELMTAKNQHPHSEALSLLNPLPYGHSPFFTDREAIFANLYDYFVSHATLQQTCVQALNGLTGVGKTQIAVEYAHLHKHEYQAIVWLEASSRNLLNDKIISLATQLSLTEQDLTDEPHRFLALKRWLQLHDHWLLILDNLEDIALIEQFVPRESTGHVLLTTLAQATGHLARAILVQEMTIGNSALFLLRRAKFSEPDAADFAQATDIAREVGRLPLAIDQAGAYIDETQCGLARYLQLYSQEGVRLLKERDPLSFIHPQPVTTALSLNFTKVHQVAPATLKLLQLFAFLHPDAIPEGMIEQGAHALDGTLHTLAANALALEKAFALLLKYSLIQRRTETKTLSIHRVVQAILKEQLTDKQKRQWARRAVCLVSSVFPEANFNNWSICEKYFSQASYCARLIHDLDLFQKEAAYLMVHLGEYCYQRAFYEYAETYLITALKQCKEIMGPEHPDTARVLNCLASVYHKQGRYQEAEEQFQQACKIRQHIWGPEHSKIAQVLNNLALLYRDWGRYQQAETIYQEVISMYEKTLGPDHPDTAIALNNLALVYDELGKDSQAIALYQRAFSIEERTLGTRHPNTALSMNILAGRYEDQKDYAQAEALYLRTIALQEQILGSEHPDLASTLNNLAGLYEVLQRYEEAEKLYERALSMYEKLVGPEHPDIARVLNNLAYLLCQQGRYQEAEKLYEHAQHIYEEIPGFAHPDVASVLSNLGILYRLMGKNDQAELFLKRGLALCEQALGKEHIDTGGSLKALIDLFLEQGRDEEALPLCQRNLAIIQQTLGPDDPDVVLALKEYISLLARRREQ